MLPFFITFAPNQYTYNDEAYTEENGRPHDGRYHGMRSTGTGERHGDIPHMGYDTPHGVELVGLLLQLGQREDSDGFLHYRHP